MSRAQEKKQDLLVIPEQLCDHAFATDILSSHHGRIVHKVLHDDLHALDFITSQTCIGFLVRGRESFTDDQGQTTILTAHDMVIIPPNTRLQSRFRSPDGPLEAVLIFLGPDVIRDAARHAQSVDGSAGENLLYVPAHPKLSAFMNHVVEMYGDLKVDPNLVRLKLVELLLLADTLHRPGHVLATLAGFAAAQPRKNVSQVSKTFADHELGTADLAALSGRSVASFNREFRKRFGTSPGQWRNERRLNNARQLLETTDETITNIGLAVGYKSTSHFIQQFKRLFGTTPKKFRDRA